MTAEDPIAGQEEEEEEDTETTAGMTVTGDTTTTARAVTTVTTDDGTDPDPGTGRGRGRERGMGADPAGTGTAGVSRATGDDHHETSTATSITPGAGGTKTAGIRGSRAATGRPGIEMITVEDLHPPRATAVRALRTCPIGAKAAPISPARIPPRCRSRSGARTERGNEDGPVGEKTVTTRKTAVDGRGGARSTEGEEKKKEEERVAPSPWTRTRRTSRWRMAAWTRWRP